MFEFKSKPRIMIVGSNVYIRSILIEAMSIKCDCLEVDSAEAALHIISETRIDIIISGLEQAGGLELIRRVQNVSPNTVVVTGGAGAGIIETIIAAMRRVAFDHIVKPFMMPQAEAVIARPYNRDDFCLPEPRHEKDFLNLLSEHTKQLEYTVHHDVLTGLPNRALFIDHLNMAASKAAREQEYLFAVVFIDLDRFKTVIDSFGYTGGDQLLIEVGKRLRGCVRSTDTVARFGDYQFTIILESIDNIYEAVRKVERLQQELLAPFTILGQEVYITASTGISISGQEGSTTEHMVRDSHTAMCRAKEQGDGRYEVYDQAMRSRVLSMLQIENDLRRAIDRKEFHLHYQPIVSLNTGKVCGFESLVRWQHQRDGLTYPDKFISIAEDSGLILQLGHWVLDEACRQMSIWLKEYSCAEPFTMSVNLSVKQLIQTELVEQIRNTLTKYQLDPRMLKLEITESAVLETSDRSTMILRELQQMGIELVTDDFGTGYSSLRYLQNFPIGSLKIDRLFVTGMSASGGNLGIVRAIIAMAKSLHINAIAEGVETVEQLTLLQSLGCGYGQGHLFSPPVDGTAAGSILARRCITAQEPLVEEN